MNEIRKIIDNFLAFCQLTCEQQDFDNFETNAVSGEDVNMKIVFAQGEKAAELDRILKKAAF